jgi:hypothetical protein
MLLELKLLISSSAPFGVSGTLVTFCSTIRLEQRTEILNKSKLILYSVLDFVSAKLTQSRKVTNLYTNLNLKKLKQVQHGTRHIRSAEENVKFN